MSGRDDAVGAATRVARLGDVDGPDRRQGEPAEDELPE